LNWWWWVDYRGNIQDGRLIRPLAVHQAKSKGLKMIAG